MAGIKEKYLVDKNGNKVAVLLDVKDYEDLIEDVEDLRMIADRKNEPTITLAEAKRKLNGRLSN